MNEGDVRTARVHWVRSHPNADRLEIAAIDISTPAGGPDAPRNVTLVWVVVRQGEFKAGDVGFFFSSHSLLPRWLHEWLFPKGSSFGAKNRLVRQIRIRGIASPGLLIRLDDDLFTLVEKWNPGAAAQLKFRDVMNPGQDWTTLFGVTSPYCLEHPLLSPEADRLRHGRKAEHRRSARAARNRGQDLGEALNVQGPRSMTPLGQYVRVLVGVLVLLAIALALGNAPLMMLGVFALSIATLGLPLRAPASPVIERTIGKKSYWVDETVTVRWDIELAGGTGAVLVYDELPPEMELVNGNNVRLFWKHPGKAVAAYSHSYSFRCPRRGAYELAATQWEVRHPLALRRPARGTAGQTVEISVLPRLLGMRRIRNVRALAVTPLPMAALARTGLETNDFREIRQYAPGDPMRIINWKATARRVTDPVTPPLVNEYEFEGKKAVWLFVDASQYLNIGSTVQRPLEQIIEAAGGLGNYYLRQGYRLGAHFSSQPGRIFTPDTGRRQLIRLTQELLELQPGGTRYDLLAAIRLCQRQLLALAPRCIILTRLDLAGDSSSLTPEVSELKSGVRRLVGFSLSRRSRADVWVVGVRGHGYARAQDGDDGMVATIRALETRPVVRELQRSGAVVLDWDPARQTFAEVLVRQLRREGRYR